MMKHSFALVSFIVFVSCASPQSAETSTDSSSSSSSPWIDIRKFDVNDAISAPPEEHSKEYDADYATIRGWQKKRTKEQCDLARSEVSFHSIAELFVKSRGPLSSSQIKPLRALIEKVEGETNPLWTVAKAKWKRPRPYFAASGIRPCIKRESSTSYPSGTAALAQLTGLILSEVFPKQKTEIMERAFQIGENRVIGGVHHPSDVVAGRKLADAVFEALEKNPQFKKELKKLQK